MVSSLLYVAKPKLSDLKEARDIFKMNYYKNGGSLLVKSVAPSLFNMRNILLIKRSINKNSKPKVIGYIHFVHNLKRDKKDTLYYGASWNDNNVYIAQIALLNEFKGHGIASQLIDHTLKQHCRGKDVYAHVNVENIKSRNLLNRFGFKVIGVYTPKGDYHGKSNYKALIYHKYMV